MTRVLWALLTLTLGVSSAAAWWHQGTVGNCSVHTDLSSSDGCSGAPAYVNSTLSYQNTTAFTDGTFGLVMNRLSNWGWNVAGVDFAVGVTPGSYCGGALACSTTPGARNLWSPAGYNFATDPAGTGCDPSSTIRSSGSQTQIHCLITPSHTAINFQGIDLNPGNAGCYDLLVEEDSAYANTGLMGTINFSNSRIKIDSSQTSCLTQSPYGSAGEPPVQLGNYSNPMSDAFAVTASNNVIDADGSSPAQLLANGTLLPMNGGEIGYHTGGTLTAHYNYSKNPHNYVFYGVACSGIDYSYNVAPGVAPYLDYGHGDFALHYNFLNCPSATIPYFTNVNNTLWNPPSQTAYGAITTLLSVNAIASTFPTTITNTVIKLNTLITNPMPNYLAGVPTLVSAGSGYAVGDIVSIHDPGGYCNPLSGGGRRWPAQRVTAVDGGGAITGYTSTLGYDGGACNPAPATGVAFATSDGSGYGGTTGTGSGATFSIPSFGTQVTGDGAIYLSDGAPQPQSFTNVTINNNAILMSASGSLNPGIMAQGTHYGIHCANPISTNGNFDAQTGAILTRGATGLIFPTTDVGGVTGC